MQVYAELSSVEGGFFCVGFGLCLTFPTLQSSSDTIPPSPLGSFFAFNATSLLQGPDSSGLSLGVNRDWFSTMLDKLVQATVEALNSLEPATVTVSDSDWRFGHGDKRDPRVVDPTLNVLQATSTSTGRVIATVVQWSFHPEVTLGYSPVVSEADCIALGEQPGCSANGAYVSADFPGHLRSYLTEYYGGGDVVYINGALGAQIGNHGSVWEVTAEHPISGQQLINNSAEPRMEQNTDLFFFFLPFLSQAMAR